MNNPVCKCRRGIAGRFDGKCGHCRTKAERRLHDTWVRRGCPPVTSKTPVWLWPKEGSDDRREGP